MCHQERSCWNRNTRNQIQKMMEYTILLWNQCVWGMFLHWIYLECLDLCGMKLIFWPLNNQMLSQFVQTLNLIYYLVLSTKRQGKKKRYMQLRKEQKLNWQNCSTAFWMKSFWKFDTVKEPLYKWINNITRTCEWQSS